MAKNELINIGAVLKELREDNGMTLREVADIFGVTHKTIQFWEQGVNEVKLSSFIKLCELYETTPNEVLEKANVM